jgi:hypothetical protein
LPVAVFALKRSTAPFWNDAPQHLLGGSSPTFRPDAVRPDGKQVYGKRVSS